jgi:YidC/Oxa1 family membrane protein insertase
MNPFDIFIPILINPLINILLAFYHLAAALGLPGPLGWSIIFLTLAVRLAVFPAMAAQLRHQRRLAELKPHLAELKKKHGHDPKRHREEQAKLYREKGVSPAGGCLPAIVQAVIVIGLYSVFFGVLNKPIGQVLTHLNSAAYFEALKIGSLDKTFFGLDLSLSPAHYGLLTAFLLIPVVTGILQLFLAKMTTLPPSPRDSKKEPSFEDALLSSQSTMIYLLPLMTAYFAFSFPVGLALYWNVANIFAIIQQYIIMGPGGLAAWLPKNLTPSKK